MTSDPTQTADRHFLWRWFHVLDKRLLFCDRHALDAHNVRVEASGPSDWWIQVQPPVYERCHGCGFYATHQEPTAAEQEAQLRELREALVLLTTYARIDYDAWLQELKTISGLRFQKTEQIVPRFNFVVSGSTHTDGSYPAELMAKVFGEAGPTYSEEFTESYELLEAHAERLDTPIGAPHLTIPIRLEFSQTGSSSKRAADSLSSVSKAVSVMRDTKSSESPLPVFDLDCVEVRLRRHELNPATLASIGSIIDSGVGIKFLELPGRLEEPVDRDSLHTAWRILAHKLFVRASGRGTTQGPQIERLALPPIYFATDLAAAWLPLLTTTTNVRSLSIDGSTVSSDPSQSAASSLVWISLAYALFSKDAAHALESLQLCGLRNVSTDVSESMARVGGSATPRVELWRALEQHAHAVQDGLQRFKSRDTDPLACNSQENDNSRSPSKLRRLVLSVSPAEADSNGRAQTIFFITQVLRLAGRNLTDLAIDGAHVDDSALQECLELCPELENLRVSSAALHSMRAFVGPNGGTSKNKLQSLDLRSIQMEELVIHQLLEWVKKNENRSSSSVARLRIGQGWNRRPSPESLNEMLVYNQSLTYFHVFRPNGMFAAAPDKAWDEIKNHDGELMASRDRPITMDRKMALLASIQSLAEKALISPLNRDVLAHIFRFAAIPRRRTVVVEADQSSSYM